MSAADAEDQVQHLITRSMIQWTWSARTYIHIYLDWPASHGTAAWPGKFVRYKGASSDHHSTTQPSATNKYRHLEIVNLQGHKHTASISKLPADMAAARVL